MLRLARAIWTTVALAALAASVVGAVLDARRWRASMRAVAVADADAVEAARKV